MGKVYLKPPENKIVDSIQQLLNEARDMGDESFLLICDEVRGMIGDGDDLKPPPRKSSSSLSDAERKILGL